MRRYAEGGYTSIIHGKVWHEETQATASQAVEHGGRYLVVFDATEARRSSATTSGTAAIRDRVPGALRAARSPDGFDPERDLQRIGLRQSDDDADVRIAGDRANAQGRR